MNATSATWITTDLSENFEMTIRFIYGCLAVETINVKRSF